MDIREIWVDETVGSINDLYRHQVQNVVNNFNAQVGDKFYTVRMHPEMKKQLAQVCGITIVPKLEFAASSLWMFKEHGCNWDPFPHLVKDCDRIDGTGRVFFKDIPHHSPI